MLIVVKDTVTGEESNILYKRNAKFDMTTVRRAIAALSSPEEAAAVLKDLKPITFYPDKFGSTAAFILEDRHTVFYGVLYTRYNEDYVRDRNSRLVVVE